MPFYKAPDQSLHFLDDARFAYMLPPGCTGITPAAAAALQQAQAQQQAAVVPTVVTPLQAFTALDQFGLLAQVVAYIDAPDTPVLVRLAWLGATEFRRDSILVMNAAIILGLTEQQLDALFTAAAAVPV